MGRARTLPFLPTCATPTKTLSFRAADDDFDATGDMEDSSSVQSVIRGLSTDRFFFETGKTSSILDEAKLKEKAETACEEIDKELQVTDSTVSVQLKESNVSMMEMESTDPFLDFKKSMQEMAEADEGLMKNWENLQHLLSLYLAVNDKINHGYIIGAFVDFFLVNHGCSSSSSASSTSTSCSTISNSQEQQLMESGGGGNIHGNDSNNNKLMMISRESPESALSFTSSFASSSGTCSSVSHFLSSCSLEDDDIVVVVEEEDGEDLRKASVSDYGCSCSLKV